MKKILKETFQITLAVAAIILISLACHKNRFKKASFLEDLYTYKTAPEITNAVEKADALELNWTSYSESLSPENFESIRTKFVDLSNQMERINFYNLGDVSAIYVFNRFYKTTVDTTEIKNKYNASETFTPLEVGTYANTQKGLFTLEYLLFSATFKDSVEQPKYLNFIGAHLNYLGSSIKEFQNSWNVYQQNFTKNTGDGVSDSYNIVVNRMIHTLEDLINKRLSIPMDAVNPELAVGYYSNQALAKINTQVQQLNDIYLGIGTQTFNSVYNNVRKKNKKLADNVSEKFEQTINYGSRLSSEMTYYVQHDLASLENYKGLLIDLLTYFKVDIQQELEVIITFGDTDGD